MYNTMSGSMNNRSYQLWLAICLHWLTHDNVSIYMHSVVFWMRDDDKSTKLKSAEMHMSQTTSCICAL